MPKKFPELVIVLALISMFLSACASTQALTPTLSSAAQPPLKLWKVAALFPGVITDADYNTLGFYGLTEVKIALGIDITYSENVSGSEIDKVMRGYIAQGYNIIWSHGSQFLDPTLALAREMPDIVFIVEADLTVKDPPENVWLIDRNFQTGYYAIGAIAARATKSGKIGYISGQDLPFSYAEIHAMQQAFKDLNAKAEFKPAWTGDFNDAAKGRSIADAMLADGVDVIVCSLNLGIFGVFEAAKAKDPEGGHILVIAKYIDKTNFAPKNYITSLVYDFKNPMKEIVSKILKGEKGGYYPLGFGTGVSIQFPLINVSAEINTEIKQIVNDIIDGKIQVVKDTTPIK